MYVYIHIHINICVLYFHSISSVSLENPELYKKYLFKIKEESASLKSLGNGVHFQQ